MPLVGSLLAQMGSPSMATPIGYALHYPRRRPAAAAPLDLARAGELHFEPVDMQRFPAIRLGHEAVRLGGTAGAVLNAADETAVSAFVTGRIRFGQVVEIVEEVLEHAGVEPEVTMETVLATDAETRRRAEEVVCRRAVAAPKAGPPARRADRSVIGDA